MYTPLCEFWFNKFVYAKVVAIIYAWYLNDCLLWQRDFDYKTSGIMKSGQLAYKVSYLLFSWLICYLHIAQAVVIHNSNNFYHSVLRKFDDFVSVWFCFKKIRWFHVYGFRVLLTLVWRSDIFQVMDFTYTDLVWRCDI